TFTASVTPAPDRGTVRFTSDGLVIAGCSAVSLAGISGQASCSTSFSQAGARSLLATYSGDAYYTGSTSAPLAQVVQSAPGGPGPPGGGSAPRALRLTHLRLRHVHGRLQLLVVLSEKATITATFRRRVAGRLVVRHVPAAGAARPALPH